MLDKGENDKNILKITLQTVSMIKFEKNIFYKHFTRHFVV